MSLDTIVASVNKTLGEGTLIKGSDLRDFDIPRVTSGSIALDLALGGGWPLNCWCSIEGEPSNGKSVIALKTIAANQAANPKYHCLWVAAEAFVPPWAEQCGVDLDRMTIADTRVMEDAYQIIIEMVANRTIDAVVIDSLSALTPTEEDEKTMEDMQVALGARLTGKFMRKSSVAQRRSMTTEDRPCLGIIISQWREKVGVMYGDNRVTPYGRAKEFFYMIRMEVRKDEWLGSDKNRVGLSFKVRTTKNKTAPPQKMASLDFYWEDWDGHRAGHYNVPKQLAMIAMDLGIIELRGNTYFYGGKKWTGKEKMFDAIDTDVSVQHSVDKDIRKVLHLPEVMHEPVAKPTRRRVVKSA